MVAVSLYVIALSDPTNFQWIFVVKATAARPRFYHRHHHTTSFLHMLKLLPCTESPVCAGSASEIWCNLCKKRTFLVFMWKPPHSPPDYCKVHAVQVSYVPVSAVWELYLPMNKFTIFKRSSSSSLSAVQCSTIPTSYSPSVLRLPQQFNRGHNGVNNK